MDAVASAAMPTKSASIQISLRSTEDNQQSPSDPLGSYRCFVLDEENNSIILGRSSKSQSKGFVAAKDNGWYNSAVMSRQHAEIMADIKNKRVEIKDLGSLHGTYFIKQKTATGHTEVKLQPDELHQLSDGDELQLGVSVYRSNVCFQPNSLKVGINWSDEFPTKFQVPDGSDDGSSDIEIADNFIDLTQPSTMPIDDRDVSTRNAVATRCVIDLSSSPPPPGKLDAVGYESDPDLPRRSTGLTMRQPFNLRPPITFGKSASPGPVRTSDTEGEFIYTTCDILSSDSIDSEDDADSTDLDAASDTGVRETNDHDQDDNEDELEETSAPEQDEDIGWMDDETSEDGEINDDGESSMSESQNDDESDCDFWGRRPEDCSPITHIPNGEKEDDTAAPSTVKSQSIVFPGRSYINPHIEESHKAAAAYMQNRASSVHALCNPPGYAEFGITSTTMHQPAPPPSTYFKPPLTWDIHVPPAAFQYSGNMMPGQVYHPQPWECFNGEEGTRPLAPPSKRTHVGISDIVEYPGMTADKAPEKRKADDISTLNPEEERWAASINGDRKVVAPMSPAPSDPLSPKEGKDAESKGTENEKTTTTLSSGPNTETEVEESKNAPDQPSHPLPEENSPPSPITTAGVEIQRPAKRQRIRDIAERVGYAALGGVTAGAMIVGTLIYTAPTFA